MMLRSVVDRWRWWIGGAVVVIVVAVIGVARAGGHDRAPTAAPAPSSAPATTTPSRSAATAASAAPPVVTTSPAPAATDCVTRTVDSMSLAERAGQLLMIGTDVNQPSVVADAVSRYHLGGVFLHGRSTQSSTSLKAGIGGLQSHADLPLLISLDQEGGEVQTLKGNSFPRLPSALTLGSRSTGEIRSTTQYSARRLAAAGITMNLSPVADTVPPGLGNGNPPIGGFDRQFGSDPADVASAIRTVVPASQGAGVLTVLKHFPGLGRVRANTDVSTKAVDSTTTATDPYLQPFVAGMKAGSAGVMISSASYPKLDPDNIAAFSPAIITGLLRDRLGFHGLILSDDIGAAEAVASVTPGQRAVRFVAAGGDLVLSIRLSDAAPMGQALLERAQHDQTFAARLTEAATHVLTAKKLAGLLHC